MIYKNVNGTLKLVTNIRKPKKWRRFEYLQSSGTLWIDTGINPRVKPRVVAVLAMLNNADKDYWGNKAINGSAYYANFASYRLSYYRYGSTTSLNVNYTVTQNSIHEWDVSDKVYVDGNLKFTSSNTYTYNASQGTIEIFKAARSSTLNSTYRLYSFKLYDGETLVRDYVPAEFNGQYGLWDLIHNKFYENKGTGNFIVGPEIGTPYEEIEKIIIPGYDMPKGLNFAIYLQGDGQAYIDTEYLLNRNCTVSITLALTEKVNLARYVGVLKVGCYILMYSGDSGANIKTYTNLSAGGTYSTLASHNTAIHHYFINDSSHKSHLDGTQKVSHTNVPETDDYVASCYLFWANGAAAGLLSTCRIYNCRIYNNGVVVRDMRPCSYNGEAGMWDMVELKFYGNVGEGAFTLSSTISNDITEVSTSLPLYDSTIHEEPDGSEWVHIFHHNNASSNLFTSSNSFITQVHTDENRWFDVAYCCKLPKFEFLIIQNLTSGGTLYKYRWVLDINPMVAGYNDVPRSRVIYNSSTGYTVPGSSYGGLCRGTGSNTYLRANNGTGSNWWGAIGAWSVTSSAVPSWNGQSITTGCIDLYVRKVVFLQEIPLWVQRNALIGDGTAYINTGLNGHMGYTYEFSFQQANTNNSRIWGVFGQLAYTGYNMSLTYATGWSVRWNSSSTGSALVNNIHTIDTLLHIIRISDGAILFDGENKGTSTGHNTSYEFEYPLYLFTINPANTTPTSTMSGKIFYYRVWDSNGKLLQNLVPATMGGRPGLYDKVNYKMYFNANSSGNFTVE